jgi:chromate transport protein ChrA
LFPSNETVSSNAVLDMIAHNWSLGFTSFGGPTVHFQIFHQIFVEGYKWIDETTYQQMFALCQALCGPGSTKMLYAINVLKYGFWTGLLSFFVWSLPAAIAAYGLAVAISNVGEQLPSPVYALLSGLNAATVGIIALAAVQLGKKAITDTLTRILVFFSATAGMLYNALWYFPLLMFVGGITTVAWDLKLLQRAWQRLRKRPAERGVSAEEGVELEAVNQDLQMSSGAARRRATTEDPIERPESPANIVNEEAGDTLGLTSKVTRSWKLGTSIIAAFLVSFVIVMVCRGLFRGVYRGFDLFANLLLAGTIIFGGGPVVIPLLREYVVGPGWVAPRDFLLGLAITQAFPGPNFNFAVYLGTLAVAGTNIPPVVGGLIAYLAIFTPGIWLHTGFMGIWTKIRRIDAIRSCLRGLHAAGVGLVFTAVYRLFEIGYLDENIQGGGSLSRDPWWVVILATSYVGGMNFGLKPPMAIILGAVMGLLWYTVARA